MISKWPINYVDYDKKILIDHHKTNYGTDVYTQRYYEIEYIVSGCCRQEINGISYEFGRGDIAVFKVGDKHAYCALGNIEIISIIIHPDFLRNLNIVIENEIGQTNIIHLTPHEIRYIEDIIFNMEKEFIDTNDFYLKILDGYVEILICTIIRAYKSDSRKKKTAFDLVSLIEYIENNLATVTPKSVSEYASYNYSYFSRMFKEKMGINLTEYINKKKLDKAAKLLCETNDSIESIALQVGFNQKSYLHKLFKENLGTTPSKYRKSKQKTE